MITVISQHLPLIANGLVPREQVLRNIHYVETIRYNITAFNTLKDREMEVPPGFNPGMAVKGEELRHLYRFMVIWFAIEGVVRTSRSFLDHFWRTVVASSPELSAINEVRNQKYMSQALSYLRKHEHSAKGSQTYVILENEWATWSRYVVDFRNYIDYREPLGGMLSSSIGRMVQRGESVDIIIPDGFPSHEERKEPFEFSYTRNISVNAFFDSMIQRIDIMVPTVINEMHNRILSGIHVRPL